MCEIGSGEWKEYQHTNLTESPQVINYTKLLFFIEYSKKMMISVERRVNNAY